MCVLELCLFVFTVELQQSLWPKKKKSFRMSSNGGKEMCTVLIDARKYRDSARTVPSSARIDPMWKNGQRLPKQSQTGTVLCRSLVSCISSASENYPLPANRNAQTYTTTDYRSFSVSTSCFLSL